MADLRIYRAAKPWEVENWRKNLGRVDLGNSTGDFFPSKVFAVILAIRVQLIIRCFPDDQLTTAVPRIIRLALSGERDFSSPLSVTTKLPNKISNLKEYNILQSKN